MTFACVAKFQVSCKIIADSLSDANLRTPSDADGGSLGLLLSDS